VILGRAEHLMGRTEDELIRKGLETIAAQVERITKLMNQLLSFSRRRPSERRPTDLRKLVQDCLYIVQDRLNNCRTEVVTEFEEPLPPVHLDPDQMTQVLLNLLLNAAQAMSERGTLRLSLEREGDHQVKLTVADSGHGIPPDILPRIFEPFFTTKEKGKGTGLGLTVVKGIVQEHGGSIGVDSEPGQGATFTLILPVTSSSTA
jgi:signal transduction histidine kinase